MAIYTYQHWPTRRGATLKEATLIACVDDDPTVLEAVEDLLDASGFRVDGFLSAEEFLERGQLRATSCLITDMRLGGMSGLQLQDRLAMSGFRIPTIIVSAFADEQMRVQAIHSGAVCVLDKPVGRGDLLESIRDALNRVSGIKDA
jgi:FixJ family two-component response regulator